MEKLSAVTMPARQHLLWHLKRMRLAKYCDVSLSCDVLVLLLWKHSSFQRILFFSKNTCSLEDATLIVVSLSKLSLLCPRKCCSAEKNTNRGICYIMVVVILFFRAYVELFLHHVQEKDSVWYASILGIVQDVWSLGGCNHFETILYCYGQRERTME